MGLAGGAIGRVWEEGMVWEGMVWEVIVCEVIPAACGAIPGGI